MSDMSDATRKWCVNLNALAAGLFLLTSFGIVAMRQARGCLHLFIAQSLLLAASAALLGCASVPGTFTAWRSST